jgi:hypothetical protein
MGCHKGHLAKPRVHQHHDIVTHSVLNDDAHFTQTAALVVGNNNVALCPFARLLQAYRLLGAGAEIFWYPGLGASYGMLQLCGIVPSGALLLACEQHYEGAHISC